MIVQHSLYWQLSINCFFSIEVISYIFFIYKCFGFIFYLYSFACNTCIIYFSYYIIFVTILLYYFREKYFNNYNKLSCWFKVNGRTILRISCKYVIKCIYIEIYFIFFLNQKLFFFTRVFIYMYYFYRIELDTCLIPQDLIFSFHP